MLEANLHSDTVKTFQHGRTVIGTSATQITPIMPSAVKGVQFKAGPTNAGTIYVGSADVTAGTAEATDGIPLTAGEGVFLPIADPTVVYAIASAISQNLYWIVL